MNPATTRVFHLTGPLAAKDPPERMAADEEHFALVAASTRATAELVVLRPAAAWLADRPPHVR